MLKSNQKALEQLSKQSVEVLPAHQTIVTDSSEEATTQAEIATSAPEIQDAKSEQTSQPVQEQPKLSLWG